jgi:LmeA-like phospholipid-binding
MRWARRLLVVLVILTALLVGADVAARALAQSVMADRLRSGQRLAATPTVSVSGWPFLTQALRGTYEEIVVTSPGTVASTGAGVPALQHLEAHLRQVRAPLSLLSGSSSTVQVGSATATATVSYAQLEAVLKARIPQLMTVRLSNGGNGRVALRGSVTAFGITVPVDTSAGVTLTRGRLTIAVDARSLTGKSAAVHAELTKLLTVTVILPRLPYGLTVTSVQPTTDGTEVAAEAGTAVLQLR